MPLSESSVNMFNSAVGSLKEQAVSATTLATFQIRKLSVFIVCVLLTVLGLNFE